MPSYTLSLTEQDLRVIAAALNELPYRVVAPVMDKLKAQTHAQRPPEPGVPDALGDYPDTPPLGGSPPTYR